METLLEFKPEIWRSEAACMRVGVPTDVFFSDHLGDIAEAKRICADCPVILECLEAAIARHEPWGVWGGQIFRKGKLIANKQRRGRPSKVPRPDEELPVIPVPIHLQSELRSA